MKPLLLVCLVCFQYHVVQVSATRKDVFESIFRGYTNALRPVINDNDQLTILIQMQIMSLLEVNEQQEYITAAIYINMWWTDHFLTWDPSNFNGTQRLKVPASNVWQPDILVSSSSLQPEFFVESNNRIATIYFNGTVFISFPFLLTNYCKMVINDYPFDEQECRIKIASWAYTKEDLNFVNLYDPELTMPENLNTVWDIFPYVNDTLEFPNGFGQTIKEIHYIQKIKRKSTYYVWVLIAPTFIITALSLAGLYSPFNNTGDREEKVTLGLTTLLTLAVILSMVTGEMPRGSDLPVLGLFVLMEIVLIVVSMAIAVMTMFFHERLSTCQWQVPLSLCWLTKKNKKSCAIENPQNANREIEAIIFTKTQHNKFMHSVPFDSNIQSSSTEIVSSLQNCVKQLNETQTIVKESLNKLEDERNGKEEEERRRFQWLQVFDRLDLCLFILFQLIHIVGFILVFNKFFGDMF